MIDPTALQNLVPATGNESFLFLKELEQIFLTQTPKLIQQMHKGVDQKKFELITHSTHTLKSSCSYLGIIEMVDLCNQIETRISNGELSFSNISVLLKRLEQAYTESVLELRQIITNLGSMNTKHCG